MRGRRRNHNTLTLPTRKPVREGVKSLVSLPYTDTFKHCGQFAPRWFRAAGLRCRLGKLRANAEMRRQAGEWLLENKAQFARTVPAKRWRLNRWVMPSGGRKGSAMVILVPTFSPVQAEGSEYSLAHYPQALVTP